MSLSGSSKDKTAEAKQKLIEAETMETGSVKFSVLLYYMKAVGWSWVIFTAIFQLLCEGKYYVL